MVDIKTAVAAAKEFAAATLDAGREGPLLLEEVEIGTASGKEVWLITLSHPKPVLVLPDRIAADLKTVAARPREYKVFTVDGDTGQVVSMKIRELAYAE